MGTEFLRCAAPGLAVRHRAKAARSLLCAGAIALAGGCSAAGRPAAKGRNGFQSQVAYLAADARDGRGLGTKGIAQAATFLATEFRRAGLEPAGDDGTFFQAFSVRLKPQLSKGGFLAVEGAAASPRQGKDFIPYPFSSAGPFEGDAVFAGYGITADDRDYDDYRDMDVSDKVVVVLRGEPASWETEEDMHTPHALFSSKVYAAREQGAAAILIVDQLKKDGEPGEDMTWRRYADGAPSADFGLPALHVTRGLADAMTRAGGLGPLTSLEDRLDEGKTASAAMTGIRLRGKAALTRKKQPTRNVLGLLRGEGALADEVLVIGAHYDHLGVIVPRTIAGRRADKNRRVPAIHNGADDNASGTAGLIQLAHMLQGRTPLKRSVLIIAFTGEESGLLGSKHYVEHPTVPLEKVVAMVNLDMIGRLPEDSRKVQVFGTKAAEGFEELLTRRATDHDLTFQGSGSAFGPSDHTSFYAKGIPAVHVFTGLHKDYHLPTDDVDKINADGAMDVLAYVRDVACELIDADERPQYQRIAPPAHSGRARYRVRMGIMPSYAEDSEGMAVDGVLEDGPADAAGMHDGDVIVRIGAAPVKNIYDYMAALRGNRPGDVVGVTVVRDDREITLQITLVGSDP